MKNGHQEHFELTEFVYSFFSLIEMQIASAQRLMGQTVANLMDVTQEIESQSKMKDFSTIQSANFSSRRELEDVLSSVSEHFTNVDDLVRQQIFRIIGAVSADDVIRQRLEHCIENLKDINHFLMLEIPNEGQSKAETLEMRTDKVLESTFKKYTSEDEKRCFYLVFSDFNKAS